MATLEELVVEIKARDQQFAASLAKIDTRLVSFERQTSAVTAKAARGFASLGSIVNKVQGAFALLGAAAALGGLTRLVTGALDSASALVDMADTLGVGVEQLQALQFAASQSGVGVEQFNAALAIFERNIGEAVAQSGPLKDTLKQLGLDAETLAQDPVQALLTFSDRLKEVPNQMDRVRIARDAFGRDPKFINFIQQGSAAIQEQMVRARELGIVLGEELARNAEKVGDDFEAASQAIGVQFQSALLNLAPALSTATSKMAELAKRAHDFFTDTAQQTWDKQLAQIQDLAEQIKSIEQELGDRPREGKSGAFADWMDKIFGKGQVVNQAALRQHLAELRAEQDLIEKSLTDLGNTATETGEKLKTTLTPALTEEEKALAKNREEIGQHIALLGKQNAILDQVIDGSLAYADALDQMAAAEAEAKDKGTGLGQQLAKLEKGLKDKKAIIEKLIDKEKEWNDVLKEQKERASEVTFEVKARIRSDKESAQIIEQGIAAGRVYDDIQRDLAIHLAEEEIKARGATQGIRELAVAQVDAATAAAKQRENLNQFNTSLDQGIDVLEIFREGIRGLASGTLDVNDFAKRQGQAIAVSLAEGFLFGKQALDKGFKININKLIGGPSGGIIGSLFQHGGQIAGSLFGSSATAGAGTAWQIGFPTVFRTIPSATAQAGQAAGTLFGFSLGQAAGIAAGAIFLWEFRKPLVKLVAGWFGGGEGAKTGARWGGFAGAFVGSFFDQLPTRGTRIREDIKKWLKDIEVSFAKEIKSGNFFFKETKALAEQFDLSFLDASKKILTEKTGPALAKQFQALGLFLTGEKARDLGKDAEQAATTFGNMIAAGLGTNEDVLSDAIQEMVAKGRIAFEDLTDLATEFRKEGLISIDFYKDAIQGAADIFFGELPEAIGVAKIALKSFTEEGIFDIDEFNKRLKRATDEFDLTAGLFREALLSDKDGEEAARLFGVGLEEGLALLAKERFIQDFIENRLFEGIDFSDGLDSAEIDLLRERTRKARIEMDALGDAFDGASASADGLVNTIQELNRQIAALQSKRIDLRLSLISDLESIGAITSREAIAAKIAALQPRFEELTNPPLSPIGTRSGIHGLTTEQLEEAIRLTQQMRQLTVARYQAEEQAIRTALATQIAAIQQEFAARRTNLEQERQDVQTLFQERLDGLRTELQLAQEFGRVAESIQGIITGIIGAGAPTDSFAFFQRRAADLRTQLAAATPEQQPALMQELAQVLQQMLGAGAQLFAPSDQRFLNLQADVLRELEALKEQAGIEGAKAVTIEEQIRDTEIQMAASLASIDAQLASLSQQEQAAIAEAQAGAEAQIQALRTETVTELKRIHDLEDELLGEQIRRLEEQRQVSLRQLEKLVGVEEAARLLADPNSGLILSLATLTLTIDALDATISGFLSMFKPAQSGFQGTVHRPTLFLAGEAGSEYVSVTPEREGAGGGMVFSPTIIVNGEGNAKEIASAVGRVLDRKADEFWRRGWRGAPGSDARREIRGGGR